MKLPPPSSTSILALGEPPTRRTPSHDLIAAPIASGVGRPAVTSSRAAMGWCCQWYASARTRRREAAIRASLRASSALEVMGFSIRTCFPALSAAAAHR
eukprot:scaffold181874_cov40-Tisochrysis_lutea.AAC.2